MTTKDKVLEILSQNKNKSVSGEKLAEVCQVSRAAIWKAVKSLREQGCIIDGTTNGGYLLSGNGDAFSHELFSSTFKNRWPEFQNSHLETFQEIDSTNTYAKRILSECGNLRDSGGRLTEAGEKYHQSVIVAESQTAGRGRLGRKFISPAKTGIYLSFRWLERDISTISQHLRRVYACPYFIRKKCIIKKAENEKLKKLFFTNSRFLIIIL